MSAPTAPVRAEHPATGPVLAEPPSPAAAEAMARLERAFGFTTVEVAAHAAPIESPGLSTADLLAHEAASHVRVTLEAQRAVARYKVASAALATASRVLATRTLTAVEASDFEYVQDVMREARTILAAAGQLHLIGLR
ncbi:hypothetical protein [Streptomyces sp. SID8499]|uniref:hypothetical protein n=1 Tax=Streptomyces sp. SID8499 TaxID=2706106 RepID=UPI0013CD0BD0|nr:hypothetical protein [Streptomyces sp. SID8499]NED31060.1 hypothetical protein [Streptomyces sp. SID8499]